MSYSKDEFTDIMLLADRIEEAVEHHDLVLSLVALSAVIARGGRIMVEKSEGAITKQDVLAMVFDKVDYWFDFYEHMDEVKTGD